MSLIIKNNKNYNKILPYIQKTVKINLINTLTKEKKLKMKSKTSHDN